MIPRYLRVVYWILIAFVAVALCLLLYGCERKQSRIAAMRDESRIAAPTDLPDEPVSIAHANDSDGSIVLEDLNMALPADPSQRARLILERMFRDSAQSASTHPTPAGVALTDVFLLNLPVINPGRDSDDGSAALEGSSYGHAHMPDAQLAVVNLTKTFADAHRQGIETEDLTLRAIAATLHANFPDIEQVRFLVDGQPRETLNGHADLSRPYLVADPAHFLHVLSTSGDPM